MMWYTHLLIWIISPTLGFKSVLNNALVKVALVGRPPYTVIEKDENGTFKYSGPGWDFLYELQKATNCTFAIVRPPDGLFGTCYSMTNCTGMIGMVQRKEVDFALGTFLLCLKGVAII